MFLARANLLLGTENIQQKVHIQYAKRVFTNRSDCLSQRTSPIKEYLWTENGDAFVAVTILSYTLDAIGAGRTYHQWITA